MEIKRTFRCIFFAPLRCAQQGMLTPIRILFYSTCSPVDCEDYDVYLKYFTINNPDLETRALIYFATTKPFQWSNDLMSGGSRVHLFGYLSGKYSINAPNDSDWQKITIPEEFRSKSKSTETEMDMLSNDLQPKGFDGTLAIDHSQFDLLIKGPYLGDVDQCLDGWMIDQWKDTIRLKKKNGPSVVIPDEFEQFINNYKSQ